MSSFIDTGLELGVCKCVKVERSYMWLRWSFINIILMPFDCIGISSLEVYQGHELKMVPKSINTNLRLGLSTWVSMCLHDP